MMLLRVGPLVRAVSADSAVIWAELPHSGEVILSAAPMDGFQHSSAAVQEHTATATTVQVGGRYYVAPKLTALQPATWYRYRIYAKDNPRNSGMEGNAEQALPVQCFRTLDSPDARRPLTLAYGSCRKAASPRFDALSAFGCWLMRHYDERERLWPRLLLLIGDQIYADEPSQAAIRINRRLRRGARSFADFASLYEFACTRD